MTTLFVIIMAIIGLIVAGVVSSAFVVGLIALVAIGCVITFVGAIFSWPVIITAIVVYWLVKDKPCRRDRSHYRY